MRPQVPRAGASGASPEGVEAGKNGAGAVSSPDARRRRGSAVCAGGGAVPAMGMCGKSAGSPKARFPGRFGARAPPLHGAARRGGMILYAADASAGGAGHIGDARHARRDAAQNGAGRRA